VPQAIDTSVFKDAHTSLFVPQASWVSYHEAEGWEEFAHILVAPGTATYVQEESSTIKDEYIYVAVEQMPRFCPGSSPCNDREVQNYIMNYTAEKLYINAAAGDSEWWKKNGAKIKGIVIVRFVVTSEGTIGKVVVEQNTVDSTVAKVIENGLANLVKSMPKWIPGQHEGRAVNVWFVLPLLF
jgi:protein TonB